MARTIPEVFSAMDDSVNVINNKKQALNNLEDIKELIRNIEHLEIMLKKQFVKDNNGNSSKYQNAINNGKAALGL